MPKFEPIPPMCACQPPTLRQQEEVVSCTTCGASAVMLSYGVPAFMKDRTPYQMSVQLTPALLKRFALLLKEKTGLSTPELLARAREGATLVIENRSAHHFHYALSDLIEEGLPVSVTPPYPHP